MVIYGECVKKSPLAPKPRYCWAGFDAKLKTNAHKLITKRYPARCDPACRYIISKLKRSFGPAGKVNPNRLLGAGLSDLCSEKEAELSPDLLICRRLSVAKPNVQAMPFVKNLALMQL